MPEEEPNARTRPDAEHPKVEETEGRTFHKQREIKDDGRYIIYYAFGDDAGEAEGPGS